MYNQNFNFIKKVTEITEIEIYLGLNESIKIANLILNYRDNELQLLMIQRLK